MRTGCVVCGESEGGGCNSRVRDPRPACVVRGAENAGVENAGVDSMESRKNKTGPAL